MNSLWTGFIALKFLVKRSLSIKVIPNNNFRNYKTEIIKLFSWNQKRILTLFFYILLIQQNGIWTSFSAVPPNLINHVSNRIRDLDIITELLESFATGAFIVKDRPKLKEKKVRVKSKKKTPDRRKSCYPRMEPSKTMTSIKV